MRVLLITDWPANVGGIESYVTRVAHALRLSGHEVQLLTSSAGSGAGNTAAYVARASDNPAAQTFLQIANPFAVARLRAALREFRPHAVQVNMFEKYLSPAIFPLLRPVPTVAFVHYYKPICPTALKLLPDNSLCEVRAGLVCWRSGCVGLAEWLRDRPRYALIRSGFAEADRILTCSSWMADELRRNGISAEPLPLPVPAPDPDFARIPAQEPLFVYCGRLNREKGVDLLLRAFARVLELRPRAKLRILGDGPRRTQLEAVAAELGIGTAIRFEGRVSFAEVEASFCDAWALVAPSLWPEPLGLVAIEAITRGLPAIASASGGFSESIVDGVSGRLVPNGDEQALVDSLVDAVDHGPSTVPDHAVHALRRRHDVEEHKARLIALFREINDARRRVGASRDA